jgi:hypothetical protein
MTNPYGITLNRVWTEWAAGRAGKGQGLFDNLYGPGSDAFFALMKAWRLARGRRHVRA